MREWKTEIHTVGSHKGNLSCTTCYKSYNLPQARKILNNIRVRDDTLKRKLNPISVYILEEMIDIYFKEYAPKGQTLQQIIIKDNKHDGL